MPRFLFTIIIFSCVLNLMINPSLATSEGDAKEPGAGLKGKVIEVSEQKVSIQKNQDLLLENFKVSRSISEGWLLRGAPDFTVCGMVPQNSNPQLIHKTMAQVASLIYKTVRRNNENTVLAQLELIFVNPKTGASLSFSDWVRADSGKILIFESGFKEKAADVACSDLSNESCRVFNGHQKESRTVDMGAMIGNLDRWFSGMSAYVSTLHKYHKDAPTGASYLNYFKSADFEARMAMLDTNLGYVRSHSQDLFEGKGSFAQVYGHGEEFLAYYFDERRIQLIAQNLIMKHQDTIGGFIKQGYKAQAGILHAHSYLNTCSACSISLGSRFGNLVIPGKAGKPSPISTSINNAMRNIFKDAYKPSADAIRFMAFVSSQQDYFERPKFAQGEKEVSAKFISTPVEILIDEMFAPFYVQVLFNMGGKLSA